MRSYDDHNIGALLLHSMAEEKIVRSYKCKIDLRVKILFKDIKGLKEAKAKYDWLESIIKASLQKHLTQPKDISTPANNLSDLEANKVGVSVS